MPDEQQADDAAKAHSPFRAARRLAAFLLLATALYAAIGFLGVPRLIRWAVETKGSEALGRTATLRSAAFNPFSFRARLEGLQLRDRDGQPLFSFERVDLHLAPSGVFRRVWQLHELTIERPMLALRILPSGKLSIADLLEQKTDDSPAPRLVIERLALRRGHLDVTDDSVSPRYATSFAPLDAEVHDLVTLPGQAGDHALTLGFDRVSRLRVTGRQTLEPFSLSGDVVFDRLRLPALAERIAPASAMQLRGGEAGLHLRYDLRRAGTGGLQLEIRDGELTASGLALGARGSDGNLLELPRLEVRGVKLAFPARHAEIASLRFVEPRGAIAWDERGRFNWSTPPTPPSVEHPGQPHPESPPWTVSVASAALEGGTLHIDDRQPATPVHIELTGLAIETAGLSSDTRAAVSVSASAIANQTGRLSLRGTLVPSPFSLDAQTTLAAIDLLPFRPYVDTIPGLTLAKGQLELDGRMRFSGEQPYLIEGDGVLHELELVDANQRRLLACRTASLRRLRFDGAASRFRIHAATLDGAYANVAIDRDGNLNLSSIGQTSDAAPPAAQDTKGSFDVGTIELRNSTIDYRDDSLALPFTAAIEETAGRIADFPTTAKAASTIRLDGRVGENGSMSASGTMRASDPLAGTDLALRFRNVKMPTLTPYSAEFAGYAIESGALDVDVHYRIVDRRLNGDHRVVATDMNLGPKVGGSRAGFAVRLAVALLKDREGRIRLDVPIEGTVDSPEFNYRSVFWQAVKTILGNAVKAPFRALGASMGLGGGEELESVAFEPGASVVTPPEAEKLTKLATELAARPGIALQVAGRFDSEADGAALREARLAARIAERRDAPAGTEPPSLDAILESLYADTFDTSRLEQVRASFAAVAAAPPEPAPRKRRFWRREPPPTPPAAMTPATFDAAGFYAALREELAAAEPVSDDDFRALAEERATAIAATISAGNVLTSDRVRLVAPAQTQRSAGAAQVACELDLSAGDE
jgi:hypothetical protein